MTRRQSRRQLKSGFFAGKALPMLDEGDVFYLVAAALPHLSTDDIIRLVMGELDDAGRERLMSCLEAGEAPPEALPDDFDPLTDFPR